MKIENVGKESRAYLFLTKNSLSFSNWLTEMVIESFLVMINKQFKANVFSANAQMRPQDHQYTNQTKTQLFGPISNELLKSH